MPVTVTQDHMAELAAALSKLSNTRVMVGIPSDKAGRRTEDGGGRAPINNAAIGYIMENGAPEANIPARPWLVPGVREAQNTIIGHLKNAGKAALDGDVVAMDNRMHAVGLSAQSAVRGKITRGPFQPLAPRTIAARKRRGRTGIKPLLDTGQLRNAVNYVIRLMTGKP